MAGLRSSRFRQLGHLARGTATRTMEFEPSLRSSYSQFARSCRLVNRCSRTRSKAKRRPEQKLELEVERACRLRSRRIDVNRIVARSRRRKRGEIEGKRAKGWCGLGSRLHSAASSRCHVRVSAFNRRIRTYPSRRQASPAKSLKGRRV